MFHIKSLSFLTWNLIEYLHTQDFQKDNSIWTSEQIFYCFTSCIGMNNTQIYLNGIEEEETCFDALLYPRFKPLLLT